jgi:hypothetical protein
MREERRVIKPVVRSVSLRTEGKRMSKPSDKIIGNTKKVVVEFWATASSLKKAIAGSAKAIRSDPKGTTVHVAVLWAPTI